MYDVMQLVNTGDIRGTCIMMMMMLLVWQYACQCMVGTAWLAVYDDGMMR